MFRFRRAFLTVAGRAADIIRAVPFAERIHYAERGERRPALPSALFIHGAGASSAIWSMVLARVARFAHAIAIDLPGHGPTPLEAAPAGSEPPTRLSLDRYRDAIGTMAATLCLGPSVLVGHSMGALVALGAAIRWPEKVRALVLCGAAPRPRVHAELERLLRVNPDQLTRWLGEHALSPHAAPAIRRGFIAAGSVAPIEVTRADFEIVAAADLRDALKDVRCPVYWLDGADDELVAPDPERGGRVVTLPRVGHLVPIEAPAAVAEAVHDAAHAV